jgi:hypothetical protein
MYVPLLYFVRLTAGKYKLLRALVLYLWISLLKLNKFLLLIAYTNYSRGIKFISHLGTGYPE